MQNIVMNANKMEVNMNLGQMKVNECGVVVGFEQIAAKNKKKYLMMGLINESKFKIKRVAPFGDPVEIEIKGYSLSLRKSEAENILVKKLSGRG